MKQKVLTYGRAAVHVICTGERKRKSVRRCIVDANISVSALVVKKVDTEITELTENNPTLYGTKESQQNVYRHFVVRRPLPAKANNKATSKAPMIQSIQRLVTSVVLRFSVDRSNFSEHISPIQRTINIIN